MTNPVVFTRWLAVGAATLAGLVLLTALAAICLRMGSAWPWLLVVHEDGTRTLLGTILYVEHATRELPLDILLGITIGCGAFFAFPSSPSGDRKPIARRPLVLGAISLLVIAVILVGTAVYEGPASLIENLLQNHTRPGAALQFGSHWRYHLLERLSLMLVVLGLCGIIRSLGKGEADHRGRTGIVIAVLTIVTYLALSVLFASGSAILQPFTDPQYLGHQARELLTHALVTVPLGWAACMILAHKALLSDRVPLPPSRGPSRGALVAMICTLAGVLMGLYVGIAALKSDAASLGQTKDLVMLIFPHFFEHSFSYLVVPLISAFTYSCLAANARRTYRSYSAPS